MFGNPAAGAKLLHQGFVELSGAAIIDVLDGRADVAQFRRPEPGLEALGGAVGSFTVDQQTKPFSMTHIACRILGCQLDEGLGHAVELERLAGRRLDD